MTSTQRLSCNLLFILALFFSLNGFSQKKNIADYFKEIPKEYLDIETSHRAIILKSPNYETANNNKVYFMLDILDYANGYMKISSIGDGEGENYELTFFNLSDGDKLIAINKIQWAMCCEDSQITFLKYNKGNWLDVSKKTILVDVLKEFFSDADICQFIKEEFDGQLIYKLPQKGKTIEVQLLNHLAT